MDLSKPIMDILPSDDPKLTLQGTRELAEKARTEIAALTENILAVISAY
jgi:hypothetical protein